MSDAVRDQNFIPVALGESSTTPGLTLPFLIDEVTGRLLVDATGGGGSGTVTSVSVVSANGFAGTVATATTTPAITLTTTITGILKGNGTAISAVTIGSGLSYDGTTLSATGGSSGITIGTTTITSGTNTRILYNNSGVVGEYTLTGSGTVVVMATAPTFQTSINGAYLTASEILITDGSKNIVSAAVATYPSLTELTYLKGVTSAIQTQINGKQGTITFGTGVQTALGVNIGSAGAPVLFNGALGTPSSGTVTNLTGTASININGTVGATTPTTATFTTATINTQVTLAENASIALDPAGSADGKYTGITQTGTAGYTQSFGDLVYLDPTDSRWEAADANAASGADGDARGNLGIVVVAGTDGTACTILRSGIIRADAKFPTFTINNPIYVSETAGSITQTQPTTTDVVIRIVGAALTADEMWFNPDNTWITHT